MEPLGDRLVGTVACELVHEGEPVAKQRPNFGRGRVYTPQKTVDAEEALRWALRQAGVKPDGDHLLSVHARFYSGDQDRRDLDNLLKLVLDACNEFAWADDFQVTELHAAVIRNADRPRTELVVAREGRYTKDCGTCGKPIAADRTYCDRACWLARPTVSRETA